VTPPSECPVCGADVPPNARACPECGADERSGWDEEATRYDGLNLPDDPGEDTAARKGEIRKSRARKNGIPLFWWVVGVIVLVLFGCLLLNF
jgi:predicted nucleic acid-binding Zn ribbon protein